MKTRATVWIDTESLNKIEKLVEKDIFSSVSHFIRKAIHDELERYKEHYADKVY